MICVQDEGPIRTLILARPEQRNALTPEMLRDIAKLARQAEAEARVLVLAGQGRVFCAGFDLSLCRLAPDGAVMRKLLSELSVAIGTLNELAIPVVLALHGAAIAGGCALIGGADVVVADKNAKLGYPVVRLGVSPAVSAPFLMQALPAGMTRERLLDIELISGSKAHALGLVHELVENREDVLGKTMTIAGILATKPQQALAQTKAWLNELSPAQAQAERALRVSLSLTGLDEEQRLLEKVWGSNK